MDLLPDPILETILNKATDDAKELFYCSLVSKRFETLIHRARKTLSVQVPNEGVRKFLESFSHFIKQFGCIGTLYLKAPLSVTSSFADPFVKYEFHFKYPKSVRHGLVLSAKSFTAIDEEKEVEVEVEDNGGGNDLFMFEDNIHSCLVNLRRKWDQLGGVPMGVVSVDKVVVMDSKKDEGMMVFERLDGPPLIEPNKNRKYNISYTKSYTLSWKVPILRLPESGCVLKGAKLCFIQTGNEGKLVFPGFGKEMSSEEAAKMIMPTGGVCGKDMVFLREAAKMIMEKPASSYLVRHHI